MKNILLLAMVSFFTIGLFAQEKFTISGYVRSASDGEDLYGANVFEKESLKGVSTNFYGFYSLTLPKGIYTIKFSSIGYGFKEVQVELDANKTVTVELGTTDQQVKAVVVTRKKADANVDQVQTGVVEIDTRTVKELPMLMGEPDVIKTLQLLPGVQGAGDGNGLYVRGGGPDQNLVLLDNAPVYNTGHLLGFFSVFNADAVKDIKLIKGGIPAQYGGRLSSVLDVKMKEGNMKKYKFSGGIGIISARLTAEGPIVKDKVSFIASGRISYIGLIATEVLKTNKDPQLSSLSVPWFYDINAKLNWKISEKDRVFVSAYTGQDIMNFSNATGTFKLKIPYGNTLATLRWNHLFNSKLFMSTTFVYNNYKASLEGQFGDLSFLYNSGIENFSLKGGLDFYPNDNHEVKFGYDYTFHNFTPGVTSFNTGDTVLESDITSKYGHEVGLYIQDETDIGTRVKINFGVRGSMFANTGPSDRTFYKPTGEIDSVVSKTAGESFATYFGIEPRVNLRVKILEDLSFKAGFNLINQYIHLVSQSTSTLPTEIWVPSTNLVKPQIGLQASGGFFKNWFDNTLETSVEGYYKKMWNQIEYGNDPVSNNNTELEDKFVFGEGESYGAEFLIKKKGGKFNGWIGYTLSETTRTFPDLNDGKKFKSKYDRTHDLSVVLMYSPHKKWKFNATFIYGTGQTTTLPVNYYLTGGENPDIVYEYGEINSYRLPAYHRLDLGINFILLDKDDRYSAINLSVFNAYNSQNPYFFYNETSGDFTKGTFKVTPTQVTLFPILPSISWNFKY
jgi:hypothetical protein